MKRMKQINNFFLAASFLLVLGLYSCSNDELEDSISPGSQEKPLSETDQDSITVISSFEDWFNLFGVEPDTLSQDSLSNPKLRSSNFSNDLTEKGYSSITNSSKYRTMFSSEMAKQLGLPVGRIYQCYMKYVKLKVNKEDRYIFFENDSPNCGYQPTYESGTEGTNFQKRGYAISSGTNPVTLTTHIFYVEADEWGRTLNLNYPCSPAQIQWNFTLWDFLSVQKSIYC